MALQLGLAPGGLNQVMQAFVAHCDVVMVLNSNINAKVAGAASALPSALPEPTSIEQDNWRLDVRSP